MARGLPPDLDVDRGVTARLGPTNTGKTHHAIRRMLGYRSGMIGLPLRLLAREVYDRVVAEVGEASVALVTGEEKIVPPDARYWICTVESMPVERPVSFLAVDEIQLAADPARGHVFTDRLLNARGRVETWFLGSDTIEPVLRALVPTAHVVRQPRLSTLSYTGPVRLGKLPRRSAVVAFSVAEVYEVAERLRGRHGGVAVVMGALSPRARNAQVALYQSGEVPYLVATDAIGMGLNMDVHHVALASRAKCDGREHRDLRPDELAQIAGRAGRWTRDGTFGETGGCPPLAEDVVDAIVEHRFAPVRFVWWRTPEPDTSTPEALLESLRQVPPRADVLRRAADADDVRALERLVQLTEVRPRATSGARVRLLWDVCGVPDFGNVLPEHHADLLAQIYVRLVDQGGVLPDAFVEGHLARLDRVEGDVGTLMARLAGIRTWTFVAHRPGWLRDAAAWQARARAVEDRLSDALHEALTARFVDRRGQAWARALSRGELPVPQVDGDGVVRAAGEVIGVLQGLRFTHTGDPASAAVRSGIRQVAAPLVAERLSALEANPGRMVLEEDGSVSWEGEAVGVLVAGDDWREPKVRALRTDLLDGPARGRLVAALSRWRRGWLAERVAPILRVRSEDRAARGLLAALGAGLGVVPRASVEDLVGRLGKGAVKVLRRQGVRVGRSWVWHEALARLDTRHLLCALGDEELGALPGHGGVMPFSLRGASRHADRLGLARWGDRWLRADVAELAWTDPRVAELVHRLPAGSLGPAEVRRAARR